MLVLAKGVDPIVFGGASGSTQWLGIIIFASIILIEFLFSLKYEPELYKLKDTTASITMGAFAYAMAFFVTKKIIAFGLFVFVYELFNPVVDPGQIVDGVAVGANGLGADGLIYRENIFGWNPFGMQWYVFLICQICDDFNYYWHHRFSHTIRFLWAAHIVHHSSDRYNMGTAVRNGWVTLFYKPIWWLWVPAIGFHPHMIMVCLLIEAVWQFQLHTKFIKTLGPLDKILNTHTMHQAHHAQNVEYMDKNHGGYLNIFDKLFGTWTELNPKIDIKYGVTNPPKTNNPVDILSHEYVAIWRDVKKAKSLKEGFMYIFGPPGWSPDGSTLTVKQLQRQLKKNGTLEESPVKQKEKELELA